MEAKTTPEVAVDIILRDGSTLRLRPPRREDSEALVAFFASLSDRSRYLRFHGVRAVDAALVAHIAEPDRAGRGALIGLLGDRVVGLAEYALLDDGTRAEVAFAVADELQGRGVGTRLLEQLAVLAGANGVRAFVAEVLAENAAMLRVFRDAGYDVSRTLRDQEVEVSFAIDATPAFVRRVAERDHVAVTASLRPFFAPSSVAVVGASPRRGSIGGELFRNILTADFRGATYPVNRSGVSVAGVHAYTSMRELPERADLAVICVPGELVLDAARDALDAGTRAVCVISAGFAETGAEGAARQDELLALVRSYGARLVGPNCLGIAVPGLGLNATFARQGLPDGHIGFSSQSGALGLALLEKAEERGLGFSSFVSIGNKADVSSNDLLEWWEDDDATSAILLYLESFGNPRKFAQLARRVARRKPIVALKAGGSSAGAKAASSHTAALAGSDTAVDAVLENAGVLRARNLEELVDLAVLLSSQPLPHGRGVAVLTNAGGLGILCADACDAVGLTLPALAEDTVTRLAADVPAESSLANPVDVLGSATAATYAHALPLLLRDPAVDAVIVLFVPPVVAGAEEVAAAIDEALREAATSKPVLAVVLSAEGTPAVLRDGDARDAAFPYPESAARALGLAVRRYEWLERESDEEVDEPGGDAEAARAVVERALASEEDVWLDADATRALLTAYGIPVVEQRVVGSADEAVAAAAELGFPVVVKTAAAGAHKTETGGVAVDLKTEDAVRAAAATIPAPLLVQQMIGGGVELLAGVVQDPLFGPLVAFGPGGVLAELIGDLAFRVAPLSAQEADHLVRSGRAGRLVAGFRGAPPADADALAALLRGLGRLASDLPEVSELDLNPVIAGPDSCVAVDARVRVRRAQRQPRLKTW